MRYVDPDGRVSTPHNSSRRMQNFDGNVPHTDVPFAQIGCTFTEMTAIIDHYRSNHNMEPIDWSTKLLNSELDTYFISDNDVIESRGTLSPNQIGELKRDLFLNEFTDGHLSILNDTRSSGENPVVALNNALESESNVYIVGRAAIRTSQGKSEHEIGITGNNNGSLIVENTSNNDSYRNYYTSGNASTSNGVLQRIITIGEQ